jgi:hypothetical protein
VGSNPTGSTTILGKDLRGGKVMLSEKEVNHEVLHV